MTSKTTAPGRESKSEMADLATPMFKEDCTDCGFCRGLREEDVKEDGPSDVSAAGKIIWSFRAKTNFDLVLR